MEFSNAFIGRKTAPTEKEVAGTLGAAAEVWNELIGWLNTQDISCTAWKSVSPKYGWSLRPARKQRTILYMAPGDGCFRTSFILGDRAVAAARDSSLPKNVLNDLARARRYAEGTGVQVVIRQASDLDPVRKLVSIKLEN